MKKNHLITLFSFICATAFCWGGGTLLAETAAEQTAMPINLAKESRALATNTKIVKDAVKFDENGINIKNWADGLANGTAGVYYKEKVDVGETVTVKMSGYAVNSLSGRFVVQLGFTPTYENASLYPWGTTGNAGKVINMEFKPEWLELTEKDNGTYNSKTLATGTVGEGLLYGAYNVLDKAEHTVTVSKIDNATGTSLTIAVDGTPYVKDFAVEGTDVLGGYYFSVGMQAWGSVTPTAEEYCRISELTVSNVTEWKTPANIATYDGALATNSTIAENAVRIDENGVYIENWAKGLANGTAGVYYKEKVDAGETVTVKMDGYAVNGNTGKFVVQLGFTQTCENTSLYPWATAGNTGKVINMEFKPGWLELTVKDNGTYNSATLTSGNGGKNGTLSGAYNVFDKAEHIITVRKTDTETGILLTITVDGTPYIENFAIEGVLNGKNGSSTDIKMDVSTSLHGNFYFSAGMQAWDNVTPTAGEYCRISEITVSNVYERICTIDYVINDGANSPENAATYVVGKTASFAAPIGCEKQFIGWEHDGKLYSESEVFAITENFRIKAVYVDLQTVGASIRLSGGTGLRFENKISAADWNALTALVGEENVSLGTLLLPTKMLDGSLTVASGHVLDIERTKWADTAEGYRHFNAGVDGLGDIAENAARYGMEITARAYIKVVYANGETEYFYAESVARSVYDVADAAYNDVADSLSEEYRYETETGKYSPYTSEQRQTLKEIIDAIAK